MARRKPAARDTKERILEAALAVFGERGYQAASIDDIAARAGVTKGAVYYWFTDKDDLARDLHHALWEKIKAEAIAAFDPADHTVRNLNRCFDAYLSALAKMDHARFFLRAAYAVPALQVAGLGERESAHALLRELLAEGIRRGELVPLDPSAMASALVGAYTEATLHILESGAARPMLEVVRRIVGSFASESTVPLVASAARRPEGQA